MIIVFYVNILTFKPQNGVVRTAPFLFFGGGIWVKRGGEWRYVVVDFGEEKFWINFFKRY